MKIDKRVSRFGGKFEDYVTLQDVDFKNNSVTFSCYPNETEQKTLDYVKKLTLNHDKLVKIQNFLEANKKMSVTDYIKKALAEGLTVLYNYDLMGCGKIIRVNKKSFTMLDICDYKNYLKFEWVEKNIIFDAISIECN